MYVFLFPFENPLCFLFNFILFYKFVALRFCQDGYTKRYISFEIG